MKHRLFLGQMLALTALVSAGVNSRSTVEPDLVRAPVSNPDEVRAAREAEAQRRREKHAAKMARREAQRNQHKK